MTWSQQGSAATYPTLQPTIRTVNSAGYNGSLTFRLDPASGIVYITGGVQPRSSSPGSQVTVDPLPSNFCPLASVTLYAVKTDNSGMALTITPTGVVTALTSYSTLTMSYFRDFYFTNVSPS